MQIHKKCNLKNAVPLLTAETGIQRTSFNFQNVEKWHRRTDANHEINHVRF